MQEYYIEITLTKVLDKVVADALSKGKPSVWEGQWAWLLLRWENQMGGQNDAMWPFAFYMFPTYRPKKKRKTHIGEGWRLDWDGSQVRLPGWSLHFQHLSGQMLVMERSAWSLGLWLTLCRCCFFMGAELEELGGRLETRAAGQFRFKVKSHMRWSSVVCGVKTQWYGHEILLVPSIDPTSDQSLLLIIEWVFCRKTKDTEVNFGKCAKVSYTSMDKSNETIQTNLCKSRMRK